MSTVPVPDIEEQQEDGDGLEVGPRWHTIASREIEERGFGAVGELLRDGPVRVSVEHRLGYGVMSEALFDKWRDDRHEAYVALVQAALAEVAAGNVQRYDSAEELMAAIKRSRDTDDE